ncbi:MAG: TraB/GumN family protein [Hadesarchaea archaeon]|nr:TraB/GumN family protein [Hadesarchaea archaeon]
MIKTISDRLTLIGTAHILPESVEEVKKEIQEKNPEIVAVELCPSRYVALTTEGNGERSQGGGSGTALMNKVLYFVQNRFAQQTGSPAGKEMLTAIESAQNAGAEVELIDQDISITLQKFMKGLGFWGKLRLLIESVLSILPFGKKIDLENITEEEVVERLLKELKEFSEPAYNVLIRERNQYMADRITRIMKISSGQIICVVGAGHMPGLYDELEAREEKGDFDSWENIEFKIE